MHEESNQNQNIHTKPKTILLQNTLFLNNICIRQPQNNLYDTRIYPTKKYIFAVYKSPVWRGQLIKRQVRFNT
jgi:hypothetical protein